MLKERGGVQEIRVQELFKEVREGFALIERGDSREFSSPEEIVAHITAEGREKARSD